MMPPLVIPVFGQRPPAPKASAAPKLDTRLVAALRWDFEIGLLSMAQVVEKYRLVVSAPTARAIMNRKTYTDVQPARNALAWCKRSWRLT